MPEGGRVKELVSFSLGLLSSGSVDVLGCIILCDGSCLVHSRIFSSVPGLYPLDANSTPSPICGKKKCPQTLLNVSWVGGEGGMQSCPQIENLCCR